MKRLSIGLGSVLLLIVVAAYAGNGSEISQGPEAGLSEAELQRKATREAIRRAVRGNEVDPTIYEKRYESISHEEIEQYVGSWIKLETYFGRKVEGVLRKVQGNMLYVDEHVGQGSASYPINKTKLSKLKVLR
ncbi:hypothetical protein Q4488_07615 [Amphritea sp. 1_MG-2023]|uniref:hypothetical protein n=1 Tax=Amphritea sp. 1_MG-2023 TaxID=3062670 RepID=UPI0026E1E24E|nr:hypothetical protein [Amphritea sp. 1_MG-2023]MDO6563248.1 hypothetical protein [Amphritea sp. 1_MG-2023]